MKATFTRKEFALAVACALAFGILSETVHGQDEHAIVMDSSGVPVTSGFGLCLRSGADRHVFIEVSGTRIAQ